MPLWLTPLELRALQFEQQPSFKARLDASRGRPSPPTSLDNC